MGAWSLSDSRASVSEPNSLYSTARSPTSLGKSFFTRVARVLALQDGIPTIFCDTKEYYWYADDNGCRKVRLDASDPHSIQAGTLVLVDSSAALKAPPSRFCTENFPGYLVQATSLQEDPWKRWMKHRNGVAWVMSPWQQDEVKSLQYVLECPLHTMVAQNLP